MVLGDGASDAFLRARIETDFLLLGSRLYVDPLPQAGSGHVEVGLELPGPVLQKLFYENAGRILGIR
jgi:hypothetical protein